MWGEDLALQFFRGYLLAKCCASPAGFLPEMKGLEDIQAFFKTKNIPYNTELMGQAWLKATDTSFDCFIHTQQRYSQ